MGLQEPAGTELNDRERHADHISISALIAPVSGLIHSDGRRKACRAAREAVDFFARLWLIGSDANAVDDPAT